MMRALLYSLIVLLPINIAAALPLLPPTPTEIPWATPVSAPTAVPEDEQWVSVCQQQVDGWACLPVPLSSAYRKTPCGSVRDCVTKLKLACDKEGGKCVRGGASGKECDSNADCESFVKYCVSGTCDYLKHDEDPKYVNPEPMQCEGSTECVSDLTHRTCNPIGRCVLGGGDEVVCGDDSECVMRCDPSGKCSLGGFGIPCKPGVTDCTASRCDSDGSCGIGNNGHLCDGEHPCNESRCFYDVVSKSMACSPQGNGGLCKSPDDCKEKRCAADGKCQKGGYGPICSTGDECPQSVCFNHECSPVSLLVPRGKPCKDGVTDCGTVGALVCSKLGGSCVEEASRPDSESGCSVDTDCKTQSCYQGRCLPGIFSNVNCTTDENCLFQTRGDDGAVSSTARYSLDFDSIAATGKIKDRRVLFEGFQFESTVGSPNAPVHLVMFHDATCGMCRRAYRELLPPLMREFVALGTVRLSFAELPLLNAQQYFDIAAALKCTGRQGSYAEILERIGSVKNPDTSSVVAFAREAGLDIPTLATCIRDDSVQELVRKERALAAASGFNGTPSFVANGIEMGGYMRWPAFKEKLDAILQSDVAMKR